MNLHILRHLTTTKYNLTQMSDEKQGPVNYPKSHSP